MDQAILTATQEAQLSVSVKDRRGNAAQVQSPTWSSSDDTVLVVVPDENDPLKAVMRAVGPVGTALVTFDADADMGEGVVDIIGTLAVVVTAGQATIVSIEAAAPTESTV